MKPFVIALTGASGILYGVRLVHVMAEMGYEIALVISDSARLVIKEELGISPKEGVAIEDYSEIFNWTHPERVKLYAAGDFTAPIASGSSYP